MQPETQLPGSQIKLIFGNLQCEDLPTCHSYPDDSVWRYSDRKKLEVDIECQTAVASRVLSRLGWQSEYRWKSECIDRTGCCACCQRTIGRWATAACGAVDKWCERRTQIPARCVKPLVYFRPSQLLSYWSQSSVAPPYTVAWMSSSLSLAAHQRRMSVVVLVERHELAGRRYAIALHIALAGVCGPLCFALRCGCAHRTLHAPLRDAADLRRRARRGSTVRSAKW